MKTIVFNIKGLDCAEEVAALRREVAPVVGGADRLTFDILNGRMAVSTDPDPVDADDVRRAVARTGMRAEIWQAGRDVAEEPWTRRLRALLTLMAGLATAAGFALHAASTGLAGAIGHGSEAAVPLPARGCYALAVVAGLWLVAPRAWHAFRRARPDMNLLMTVAVAGAMGIGEWFEAATVAFLFAFSLELESWSIGRARRAVASLMELAPAFVRLRGAADDAVVAPETVEPGAIFVVRPGERVPLDGIVAAGAGEVNQAQITGESRPVFREPGDAVFAGSVNGEGALEIESTRRADETTLHHIIRMVEEAQSRRAPSERWVERFARVYTPAVLVLAALVLVVPPLFLGGDWGVWLYRALVLLVIGCPCALVISTPVTIVAALAAAAHNGVLVKGGAVLEVPARIRALAFDKTGTLTGGRPVVSKIVPLNGHDENELLERAAAMESSSNHPLAAAVMTCARERGVRFAPASSFQVIPGKGATGVFDGRPYWLGSHRYLEERGQETPEVHDKLEALSDDGQTVVVIGNEEHVCGFIAAADRVRPEARDAVAALRRAGVDPVVMLTGDNEGTARAIGREAGIEDVRAELLPDDKLATVEALVERHGVVAMVGDGVNDAPAMARASLGIAMGAAGSDAAIETADVALMSDDLSKIPWLVHHSRRTLRVIRQNIAFALSIKALFVALTFVGLASLWAAIAADMGASLLVIFNGLRLLRTE